MEFMHIQAEAGGWRETPTGRPRRTREQEGLHRGAAATEPPSACPASSTRVAYGLATAGPQPALSGPRAAGAGRARPSAPDVLRCALGLSVESSAFPLRGRDAPISQTYLFASYLYGRPHTELPCVCHVGVTC